MPDILGVTNPVPGYDRGMSERNTPISIDNTQIENITDPTKVTRADAKTEQQDSSSGSVRYDSNFQTFLQQLREAPSITEELSRLFGGREGTIVLSGMSEGIATELSQVMQMMKMDPSQLHRFLTEQFTSGTRFGGALFALLRNAYARADSDNVKQDILQFLKAYSDHASTGHIEGNLIRNVRGMAESIPASWGNKLLDMLAQLENGIAAGDRAGNISLLQRSIFPFMSAYVGQTHDVGLGRAYLALLALDVARYENGSEEKLLEAFHQLISYGTLKNQLGALDDQSLLTLLHSNQFPEESSANQFSAHLAEAAARALRGEGNAQAQEALRNLSSAILINESVYMPVNHYLIPMEWNDRMLFSELWVDPDAENDGSSPSSGRDKTARFLFKMDVQSLGLFDVILTCRGQDVSLRVACPDRVAPFSEHVRKALSQILSDNGLTPTEVMVVRMDRPVTLTEVFPKLFEGKNSVNVKV